MQQYQYHYYLKRTDQYVLDIHIPSVNKCKQSINEKNPQCVKKNTYALVITVYC